MTVTLQPTESMLIALHAGKSASVKSDSGAWPVNDSEPLDVCLHQQLIKEWVGRGAWWQCLFATDRANGYVKAIWARQCAYTARYTPVPVKSRGARYT